LKNLLYHVSGSGLASRLVFPPLFTRIATLHRGYIFNLNVLILEHDKYR
jgi:hypothetical protein